MGKIPKEIHSISILRGNSLCMLSGHEMLAVRMVEEEEDGMEYLRKGFILLAGILNRIAATGATQIKKKKETSFL